MATNEKEVTVSELTEKFKQAKALYLANFEGMDMATTTKLRKTFSQDNIEYKVVKNTLAKLALKNAGIEGLDAHLKGVTAIAISNNDPASPAKVISKFNKTMDEDKGLKLKACLFEGIVFGPDRVDDIANLPTREELLSTLLGMLKAPMTKLASTLAAPMTNTALILTALKDKK